MSSVRLTKTMRQRIAEKAIEHGFSARFEELKKEQHAIADAIYNETYSEEIQEKMAALPEGFLPEGSNFWVHVGESTHCFDVGEDRRKADSIERLVLPARSKLAGRIADYHRKLRKLKEEKRRVSSEVEAVLKSARTVRQLLEIWPEAEKFIDDSIKPQTCTALAIPIHRLNSALGLK